MATPGSDGSGWKRDLLKVLLLFLLSLGALLLLLGALYADVVASERQGSASSAAEAVPLSLLDPATWPALPSFAPRMPSLQDVQQVSSLLARYAQTHFYHLLLAHCACFLFLQTFAIPGTVFFNLLGGALFGLFPGFPLCLLYNVCGAVCLYLISRHFGKRLVARFFAARLATFEQMLRKQTAEGGNTSLFIYMTSIRVFPFTPNWFVNVSSAQLGIPLPIFAGSMFVGLAPYNFLSCEAGLILSQLSSRSDIINSKNTVQLISVALLGFLLPTIANYVRKRSARAKQGSAIDAASSPSRPVTPAANSSSNSHSTAKPALSSPPAERSNGKAPVSPNSSSSSVLSPLGNGVVRPRSAKAAQAAGSAQQQTIGNGSR